MARLCGFANFSELKNSTWDGPLSPLDEDVDDETLDARFQHQERVMAEAGLNGAVDAGGAVALYTRACTGRDYSGCTNLGIVHVKGRGVVANEATARGYFQLACSNNDACTCCPPCARTPSGAIRIRSTASS